MIFSEIKTNFQGLLNRRDLTPSLTTTFIDFGVKRIQRELRVPAMEKQVLFTTDGTANVPVPGDLLEIISILYQDANTAEKLVKVDYQRGLRASMSPGNPKVYTRDVSTFVLGPAPPLGTPILLNYYADASSLVDDTDRNWLTDVSPDLLIYAALTYAADYFLDERADKFEARYNQIGSALQAMGQQDDFENASISPQWSC